MNDQTGLVTRVYGSIMVGYSTDRRVNGSCRVGYSAVRSVWFMLGWLLNC